MTPAEQADDLVAQLNLDSVGENRFIGHLDRLPFRMEMVLNEQTLGLLFNGRFSKSTSAVPENPTPPTGGILASLIAEKKADFSVEDKQIWFSFFAAHELLEAGTLLPAIREVATALQPYIDFDDQPCFACHHAKATQPVYYDNKLHLICDPCQERLNTRVKDLQRFDLVNVLYSLCWGIVLAIIGGLIWSAGWLLFTRLLAGLTLPTVVFGIIFLALAAAIAFPISWAFKKIPRRGILLSKTVTILTCLLTAAFGEAMFSGYHFYNYFQRFPTIEEHLRAWLIIAAEFGAFYFICKLTTVIMLCALTVEFTAPKLPPIESTV